MAASRYQPPAVQYALTPPRALLSVVIALWLLSAVLLAVWSMRAGSVEVSIQCIGWGLWGAAGFLCWQGRQRAMAGWLRWDGGAWWWRPSLPDAFATPDWQTVAHLQVEWDCQFAFLVRWSSPQAGAQYGWVECRTAPWLWSDLRRAVYSATTVDRVADDSGQPPFAA